VGLAAPQTDVIGVAEFAHTYGAGGLICFHSSGPRRLPPTAQ